MPVAGPRSLTGPMIALNGSRPKPLSRTRAMSCGPGVSAAIAACTACATIVASIPTSSGFLCSQSKCSGKYVAAVCCRAPGAPDGCAEATTSMATTQDSASSVRFTTLTTLRANWRAVIGGVAESEYRKEDRAEQCQSHAESRSFSEGFCDVDHHDDPDDEIDQRDEEPQQPPAGPTGDLQKDIDVVNRDNRSPSRLPGLREHAPAPGDAHNDESQNEEHRHQAERGVTVHISSGSGKNTPIRPSVSRPGRYRVAAGLSTNHVPWSVVEQGRRGPMLES